MSGPDLIRWLLHIGLSLLAVGCGPARPGPKAANHAAQPGRVLRMGMMPKLMGISYFNACRKGAEEAARDLLDLLARFSIPPLHGSLVSLANETCTIWRVAERLNPRNCCLEGSLQLSRLDAQYANGLARRCKLSPVGRESEDPVVWLVLPSLKLLPRGDFPGFDGTARAYGCNQPSVCREGNRHIVAAEAQVNIRPR